VTGEMWPVAQLAHAAHAQDARILVDAAQLAPHRPLDMLAWGVDYMAFSGHKLYAPFGAGVLVGLSDWLAAAPPYLRGGGAVDRVAATAVDWSTDPHRRHEAGTPNLVGAVALAAACTTLAESGWPALVAHEEALLGRLRDGLATIPGVSELTLWGPDFPRIGIVTFILDGLDPARLAQDLSDHHGIGVRCGKFCAHMFVNQLLGSINNAADDAGCGAGSVGAIRASFGIGTTAEHIDRLVNALAEVRSR
jgi:selenocysteine lyase/cysteine desulfurase